MSDHVETAEGTHNKQKKFFAVLLLLLGLLIVTLIILSNSGKKAAQEESVEKAQVYDVSSAVEDKSYWVFESERKLAEQTQQQEKLLKEIEEIRSSLAPLDEPEFDNDDRDQEILALKNEITELQDKMRQQAEEVIPEPAQYGTDQPLGMSALGMGGIFSETIALEEDPDHKTQHIDSYIPANSYAKAVILSGVDVSTGVSSQANPQPVLLRLIDKGNLPNHRFSHLKDCRVSAGAYGDQSSERAYLRLEKLSCVEPDGHVIETDIEGYVAGEDGKNGMRGKMIIRDGEVLKRGFMGGLLSGIGKATSQGLSTTTLNPLGATSSIQGPDVLKSAGLQGVGDAFELLARYNIQRAEQYQPVIQINAGRVVEVVFHSGSKLGEKRNRQPEVKPNQSQTDNLFRGLP